MSDERVVRLSVNLAPDVAERLRKWSDTKSVTLSEGIRRSIAIWDFVEGERSKGNRMAVVEQSASGQERIREVIWL